MLIHPAGNFLTMRTIQNDPVLKPGALRWAAQMRSITAKKENSVKRAIDGWRKRHCTGSRPISIGTIIDC
ncbi:hypothetical protein ACT9ST_21910 [Sphingobium limneticum]|jgi:hypothetical protein|uniref:hypothetical protein n=1 Tax=Sphingobium limneticum TaxID=1007511 RepID=UPI001478F374|nr:hypothetical protein [Sphingobium limneticum]